MANDPQRREAIIQALSRSSLDALAAFSPSSVLLLTGYWPVMGASFAIFTREGVVCAVVPEDEMELAQATSGAELFPYCPASLHHLTPFTESLTDPLKGLLARLQIHSCRVGLELDSYAEGASYAPANPAHLRVTPLLNACSPDMEVVSAGALFRALRAVKTRAELALIEHACRLAAAGFLEAKTAVVAGRREDAVAADIQAAFSRVANDGFERGGGLFFCMSGPNSYKASGAYARTRKRVLEPGDTVMIHANTFGDGYWTDISRTFVAGAPSEQQKRMSDAIAEAREAALRAVQPGAPSKVVDAAARSVFARHGFAQAFKHGAGHGVGFSGADANAIPRLHPQCSDPLQEGMIFNLEPAVYLDETSGMRHCDVVACTAEGARVLTHY